MSTLTTTTTHTTTSTPPGSEPAGALMRAEIAEQPEVLARLLGGRAVVESVASEVRRRDVRFVLLAARGSSDHAALYAKYLIETVLGLPCGLASMSSVTAYGRAGSMAGVLWVAVSQSGGSPDLLEATGAARASGALTLAVTNAPQSALAVAAELHLDIGAGLERSVAATKTYTAELLTLWLLVDAWAERGDGRVAALADAAATAGAIDVAGLAQSYRYAGRIVTVGRGFSYPTACEGALKLMETCQVAATAFSGADLLHGPVAHVDANTPVLLVSPGGVGGSLLSPVREAVTARGADVHVVGDPDLGPGISVSSPSEELSTIVNIVPLQRLSLVLALARGYDPDRPRGLAKVTRTV